MVDSHKNVSVRYWVPSTERRHMTYDNYSPVYIRGTSMIIVKKLFMM